MDGETLGVGADEGVKIEETVGGEEQEQETVQEPAAAPAPEEENASWDLGVSRATFEECESCSA